MSLARMFTRYCCSGCGVFAFQEGFQTPMPEGWAVHTIRLVDPFKETEDSEMILCAACQDAFERLMDELAPGPVDSRDAKCVSDGSPYR